jgi:type I restriction enzyme, S subunit
MASEASTLRELLAHTRDGEWGSEVASRTSVAMRVIRGTDFGAIRLGNIKLVPVRQIEADAAERKRLEPWDILIETAGGSTGRPTGRTVLITPRTLAGADFPVTCASFARFLRIDPTKADPVYVYWFLQNLYSTGEIEQHQVQHTGIARFQFTKFAESQRIPLPSFSEQRAIGQILGSLESKIELNERMSDTLADIARALFKSWFVEFTPVRAKAEERDPGVPKALAELFASSFEKSEVGDIPKDWRVVGLDEIGRFLNGLALQKFPPQGGRFLPVIKIAQLRTEDTSKSDKASADLALEYVVRDGDVLFSWSGSLECILWAGGLGALNQHLFKVTSEAYPKWFYFLWIGEHLEEFRHIAAGKATTMGHIQRRHLSSAKVLIPPAELLNEMSHHFAPLIDQIVQLKVASKTVAVVRNALLPKLISGEVRVPDVERIFGGQI